MDSKKYNLLKNKIAELEAYLNGGKGSGNFGHAGRPGQRGGSGKGGKGVGSMVRGVKSYEPEKKIDGGFTVDIKSGKSYTLGKSDGFAVGGFGTEKIVDRKDFLNPKKRNKILKDYYKANKKALLEKGACLGGWVPSNDDHPFKGKLILDVTKVFKSEKEAAKWAVKTDQDSITDFKGRGWPETKDLVKKYGLEKEAKKSKGKRAAERGNA